MPNPLPPSAEYLIREALSKLKVSRNHFKSKQVAQALEILTACLQTHGPIAWTPTQEGYAMNFDTFFRYMNQAKTMSGDHPDYYAGYQRGLRRHYHGDQFGTEEEHQKWMDPSRYGAPTLMQRAYSDGFAGLAPDPERHR